MIEDNPSSDAADQEDMVAGWYPAPYEIGFERYWDGTEWTEDRREVPLVTEEERILMSLRESQSEDTEPDMKRLITVLIGAVVVFVMAIGGLFFLTSQFVNQ